MTSTIGNEAFDQMLQFATRRQRFSLIKKVISSGRIDFSKSKTRLDSCNYYHIENKIDGKKYIVLVNNCDDYVLVDKFRELN